MILKTILIICDKNTTVEKRQNQAKPNKPPKGKEVNQIHEAATQTSGALALEWRESRLHRNSLWKGMSGPGVTSPRLQVLSPHRGKEVARPTHRLGLLGRGPRSQSV